MKDLEQHNFDIVHISSFYLLFKEVLIDNLEIADKDLSLIL